MSDDAPNVRDQRTHIKAPYELWKLWPPTPLCYPSSSDQASSSLGLGVFAFHLICGCCGVWQHCDDSWARHETCCHSHLAINAKIFTTTTASHDQARPKRDNNSNKKTIKNNREMRQNLSARPVEQAFRLYGIINS